MAFLKYERCEDEIGSLEYEQKIVKKKLSQSANAETELKKLSTGVGKLIEGLEKLKWGSVEMIYTKNF